MKRTIIIQDNLRFVVRIKNLGNNKEATGYGKTLAEATQKGFNGTLAI